MKRIGIVTSTRAEYGLLTPIIKRVSSDEDLVLDLMVTGTHLSKKHGNTVDEIKNDGYEIAHEIPIIDDDNNAYGISLTMANTIKGFAECFRIDCPDFLIILGDRTEVLGVAIAALNERIPLAHIHGGEITEGAVDDCIRHAITKLSFLHFTATEVYRNRVIQLGEAPERVFNVGALGVENILSRELLDEKEIKSYLGVPEGMKYCMVTFHPVTMNDEPIENHISELCGAMRDRSEIFYVITSANADIGGNIANDLLKRFARDNDNAAFFYSLGMTRYLSAVKYSCFVLGNSSSGILEAPALGTPSVNIGDRQKGRIMAKTVITCSPEKNDICRAIDQAMCTLHEKSDIYGDGNTSEKIVSIVRRFLDIKTMPAKSFYDIQQLG